MPALNIMKLLKVMIFTFKDAHHQKIRHRVSFSIQFPDGEE